MDWQNILKENGYVLMIYVLIGLSSTEVSGTTKNLALIQ